MYVPGLRFTLNVLLPPWNVGVAPTTEPLLEAIVRLCATGELFVKSTVTLPADADSDEVSNLSAPLGSAASFNVPPATAELAALLTAELADELTLLAAEVAAELTDELIDDAADEAADDIELLALDPPQPATAIGASTRMAVRRRLISISLV